MFLNVRCSKKHLANNQIRANKLNFNIFKIIYFYSLLLTKQRFTPILAYRRSSVVINKSYSNRIRNRFYLNKICL